MSTGNGPKALLTGAFCIMLAASFIFGCSATKSASTENITPARSIAEVYVDDNLQAFVASPSSLSLHRVGCGMFNAKLDKPAIEPETLLVRYLHQPDEYRAKVWLLLQNSVWFTDYVTASPSFEWNADTLSSTPDLLRDGHWKLQRGSTSRIITWDEVITLVMENPRLAS